MYQSTDPIDWVRIGHGESASTVATTLGVSRATVYRVLAEHSDEGA
jgi:predicted transcriptional regulator